MKKILFHPLAQQELADSVAYYEQQQPGLGLAFVEEIEQTIHFLRQYPEAGSKNRGSTRRLNLTKFPYSLHYRLDNHNQIRILAIAHHKRRPDYWQDRQ